MSDKRVYHFEAKIENIEIRGVKTVEGSFVVNKNTGETKTFQYIDLICDDENMERVYFKDKNMGNIDKYKRGQIGTVRVRIDVEQEFGTKTTITFLEFIENEN